MLNLKQAQAIIDGAIAKAGDLSLKPLSIFVLDARGVVKASAAQDGTSLKRNEVAYAKAHGSIAMGVSSRKLEAMAKERPHFLQGAVPAIGGALVPVAGGVLIADGQGAVIGAIGISGDTSDNDEAAAVGGIENVGLSDDI